MPAWFCATCAAGFPPALEPPARCPVCEDERQYVGWAGQRWLSGDELAAAHRTRVEEVEPGLLGVGLDPPLAIGQRALVTGGLMWDCVPLVDDAAEERLRAAGGVRTIAISHPHYYTGMVDWAERFDARVLLHEADRTWIMRPSPRVELWSGDRLEVDDDHELIRLGGHFEGGTVCLWRGGAGGRGALLSGDVVQVVADRDWVSFMWSFPNYIPLSASAVRRIRDRLDGLRFERLYGAFWPSVVDGDARAKTLRSAERYLAALA